MGILDDLPRGVPDRVELPDGLPSALWTHPGDVSGNKDFWFDGTKLFLGEVNGERIGIGDDRHVMTVAGSRAGKGLTAIIPTLLEYAGSALVIDPKAELASITARRRSRDGGTRGDGVKIDGLGQEVAVLDPFGIGASWLAPFQASFNPMARLDADEESIVEDAGAIADAIVVRASERDSHWDESAMEFLKGLILHVATSDAHKDRRHLLTVYELLSRAEEGDDDEGPDVYLEMQKNEAVEGRVQTAAANYFNKPDNERGSVLSTALRNASFLDTPAMKRVLTGDSLDLARLKTERDGMTIYLCLPASRMGTHGRWFRLFINMAIEEMGRTAGRPATDLQTLFVLDEFHVLGHMQIIATAAALMAGDPYHVKLWTILQDLSQLKHLYKDAWETFLGNAGVLQFFGNNDLTTLEFASKRLGRTAVKVERGGQVSAGAARGGVNPDPWSFEVHDLLTPSEVGQFFRRNDPLRRQLVFYGDAEDPIILQRVAYNDHPYFAGKFDLWDDDNR